MNPLELILTSNAEVSLASAPRRFAEKLSLDLDRREAVAELAPGIQVMDSAPREIAVAQVDSYHFRDCSFEDGVLVKGIFTNCIFEECNFSDTRLEGVCFVGCDFHKCKLIHTIMTSAGLFARKPSRFVQCQFVQSDFRQLTCGYTLFTDCHFVRNNLRAVGFGNGIFEDCKFVGKLDETEFYGGRINGPFAPGNYLKNCDFREAEFRCINFFNINIDPSMMPSGDDILILPGGKSDLLKWKKAMYGSPEHPDFYIDESTKSIGTPGIQELEVLIDIYGSENVELLRQIVNPGMPPQSNCGG